MKFSILWMRKIDLLLPLVSEEDPRREKKELDVAVAEEEEVMEERAIGEEEEEEEWIKALKICWLLFLFVLLGSNIKQRERFSGSLNLDAISVH